jgi:glycosyltransferase involved in cell wall biosynthesis
MQTTRHSTSAEPPFGFNVYGYLTSNLGLGVAARNTVHMLLNNGVPVRLSDISAGHGMKGKNDDLKAEIESTQALPPFGINLFHLNPDQMLYLLNPLSSLVTTKDRMQVCVPFWELPKLPPSWHQPLEAMDLILAPTRYIEAAVRAELPDARVVHFEQAVHIPNEVEPNRARFGLPEEAVAFVTSFDLRSDIERKNPWAAIEAFHRAFPDRKDVRLVIKVNNAEYSAEFPALVRRLEAESRDERVVVDDSPMEYRDVLSLYASCDVLVSLHRAEGLGLSLLEAMAFGKVVVATAFSGNMDFTTADNSCLVSYRMVPVAASTQYAYSKAFAGEQEWAEPSVDEAAEWMRRLAGEPGLRESLGRAAAATAQSVRASYDRGDVLEQIRSEYEAWSATPERAALTKSRVRGLERGFFAKYGKRVVMSAWRRAKSAARL